MKTTNKMILMLLTISLISCGKSEDSKDSDESSGTLVTGAGSSSSGDAQVGLSIQGTDPATGAALTTASNAIDVIGKDGLVSGQLTLTTADIVLGEIELEQEIAAADEEEEELEFEFEGPFIVDLLTDTMSPEPPIATLPAGNYKKIKLKVKKIEDEAAEALEIDETHAMWNKSIYLSGSYTPTGGAAVAFELSYELDEEYELEGANGTDLTSGGVNNLIVAFRFAEWFDFSDATTNDSDVDLGDVVGDISLIDNSDPTLDDIRDVIKERVKQSADFGEDEDGDRDLSESEDSEDDPEDDDEEESDEE